MKESWTQIQPALDTLAKYDAWKETPDHSWPEMLGEMAACVRHLARDFQVRRFSVLNKQGLTSVYRELAREAGRTHLIGFPATKDELIYAILELQGLSSANWPQAREGA